MAWEYKREENKFQEIPEGTYRCRIESAEKAVSKNGNDMLVLKLEISGQRSHIWNYIVFLPDRPEITNGKLTQVFDSFDIEDGNFNLASYTGKCGACVIKHDEDGRARVSYFIKKDKQASLPPFVSMSGDAPRTPIVNGDEFMTIPDDSKNPLPF